MPTDLADREMFPARRRERTLMMRLRELEREGRINVVELALGKDGWEIVRKCDMRPETIGTGPLHPPMGRPASA